jgi:membrane protease YdiL (CAAX protease family)
MLSEKPWRPEAVFRLMAGLFASILLGVLLLNWLNSPYSPVRIDAKVATLIIGTLSFHGMALVLTNTFLGEHQIAWPDAFGFNSPRLARSFLLAIVVGIAILPIIWSLGQLSARIMTSLNVDPEAQETVQTLKSSASIELKMLIGVLAVVIAPVGEEIIFRGVLYPTIKQRGYPRLAFWGTSILFAAIHSNAMIFLPLTFLAVILTLLYETTNNLLAPIVTHSLFNLANFFWLIYSPSSR